MCCDIWETSETCNTDGTHAIFALIPIFLYHPSANFTPRSVISDMSRHCKKRSQSPKTLYPLLFTSDFHQSQENWFIMHHTVDKLICSPDTCIKINVMFLQAIKNIWISAKIPRFFIHDTNPSSFVILNVNNFAFLVHTTSTVTRFHSNN